jgi:hypothetical protein
MGIYTTDCSGIWNQEVNMDWNGLIFSTIYNSRWTNWEVGLDLYKQSAVTT